MSHRFSIAAVFLTALAIPAAAQQVTPSQPSTTPPGTVQRDTASKSPSATVKTSDGAIADTTAATATPAMPSVTTPSMGVTPPTSPATGINAAPSTPAESAAPSTGVSTGENAGAPMSATGRVQPTSGATKVNVKVVESLANSVKISADSAFALAKASNTAGEISSAELEMTDKRLVYQVKMVKGAGASTVYVDAMTGEVVKDKKFGGVKAAAENQEETKKLYDAKKDSSAKQAP